MARETRRRRTAQVKRRSRTDDGYGGIGVSEAVIVFSYTFSEWNVTPFDREAIVTRYGLESDAVIYFAEGEWNSTLQNLDVLDVSAGMRFKIIATEPQYGLDNDTPVALALTLQREESRP